MSYTKAFDFFNQLALLVDTAERHSARSIAKIAVSQDGSPFKVSGWRPFAVSSFADRISRSAVALGCKHPAWVFENISRLDANITLRRAGEDEPGWETMQEGWV